MAKAQYIEAGEIVNTHGVRGEVKVRSWLDSPEYLASFRTLYVKGKAVRVLSARVHKEFVIAVLEGVDNVNAAMALKGSVVYIDRADARLPEGGYFLADILGAKVVSEEGETLGVLSEVLERPGNNVYVVKNGDAERLIPAVPAFVRHTDPEAGVITVRLIEGM